MHILDKPNSVLPFLILGALLLPLLLSLILQDASHSPFVHKSIGSQNFLLTPHLEMIERTAFNPSQNFLTKGFLVSSVSAINLQMKVSLLWEGQSSNSSLQFKYSVTGLRAVPGQSSNQIDYKQQNRLSVGLSAQNCIQLIELAPLTSNYYFVTIQFTSNQAFRYISNPRFEISYLSTQLVGVIVFLRYICLFSHIYLLCNSVSKFLDPAGLEVRKLSLALLLFNDPLTILNFLTPGLAISLWSSLLQSAYFSVLVSCWINLLQHTTKSYKLQKKVRTVASLVFFFTILCSSLVLQHKNHLPLELRNLSVLLAYAFFAIAVLAVVSVLFFRVIELLLTWQQQTTKWRAVGLLAAFYGLLIGGTSIPVFYRLEQFGKGCVALVVNINTMTWLLTFLFKPVDISFLQGNNSDSLAMSREPGQWSQSTLG